MTETTTTGACRPTPFSEPTGARQRNGSRSESLQLCQLAWRRRMTRTAPVPSRPAAATATAMLGPVVARAGFVGVVRGAATTGVADGLAGVPVVVTVSVVTVVAGADGVDAGVVVSEVGGAAGAGAVVSVDGVDGVVSGVGVGLGTVVSVGGVSVVDGGVLLFVVVVLVVVVVDGVSVELLTL